MSESLCEGTSIECQRVDVKEQVWNVIEVKKQVYNVRVDVKEHVCNVGDVKEHVWNVREFM